MLKKVLSLNRHWNRELLTSNPIVFIVLLALLLRLVGIDHGFPFIFHPDEPAVARAALEIRFYKNPGHFDWPHLFIYLNYFLYMAFARFRSVVEGLSLGAFLPGVFWDDDLIFYLLSRVFSAALGGLTVIPVYLAGKELFSKKVGIFSAFAFAIFPFHVWHSHYALIDVPMTFWLSCSLYFSVRVLKEGKLKYYVLAGIFVGLSASTKYNGGLCALSVFLAHLFRISWKKTKFEPKRILEKSHYLLISGVASVVAFVLGTPYSLLDFDTFIRTDSPKGALWQFSNVGSVPLSGRILQVYEAFLVKFPSNLGVTFVVIFVIAVFYSIDQALQKKVNHKIWFLIIPAIVFIYYVSGFDKNRAHYYMIAYPFIALVLGWFLVELWDIMSTYLPDPRTLVTALTVFIFSVPLYYSILNAITFAAGDTRLILDSWLTENSDQASTLIYDGDDISQVVRSHESRTLDVDQSKWLAIEDIRESSGFLIVSLRDGEDVTIGTGRIPIPEDIKETRIGVIKCGFMRGPEIGVYELPSRKR